MLNFWEQMGLNIVMTLLQQLKLDPSRKPLFKTILVHILNDTCELLGVAPPVVP